MSADPRTTIPRPGLPGLELNSGLDLVPTATEAYQAIDLASDQEVRWCPGCGDFGVLAAFKELLPTLGVPRENLVFISGIGCSSRFPYYLNTYGMHSVHGRAPAIATGLAMTRPDLSIWVITGDGDALSIGGNHFIHALRRNVNIKIILFNNGIYGLTKGQYSPTSPIGTMTKSSPSGSSDHPFTPMSLALGAEASFVGRAIDVDRAGLTAVLSAAARHRGSAFVEILQDCPVFNAGALDSVRKPEAASRTVLPLEHGAPMLFGPRDDHGNRTRALVREGFGIRVVDAATVAADQILRHDETDLQQAFALSRCIGPDLDPTPVGIIRRAGRRTYDDAVRATTEANRLQASPPDLQTLLDGTEFWDVAGSE
jgi:2-oxoglutarate/2-oxoacid ferredoxin oxidoreductase subunit beta